MNKKIIAFVFCLFLQLTAQETQVYVTIKPEILEIYQPFELSFVVENGQSGQHNFSPTLDFGQIQSGPFKSSSTSMSWVNGVSSNTQSIKITYWMVAKKTGHFTIPSYQYTDKNGRVFASEPLDVQVHQATVSEEPIAQKPFFATVQANKSSAYIGEPILLQYKIYTQEELAAIQNDTKPQLSNLWSEEISLGDKGYEISQVNLQGKNYYVYTLKRSVVYAQKKEDILIQPWKIEIVTGDGFFSARKSTLLSSQVVKIKIEALPTPIPKNFSGLVGDFHLEDTISHRSITANQAINRKITLKGSGNLALFNKIPWEISSDFEVFEPKIEEKIKIHNEGQTGSKIFDYVFVPRFAGDYEIPEVRWSYFNYKEKKYQELKLEKIPIKVSPALANTANNAPIVKENQEPVLPKNKIKESDELRYLEEELGFAFTKETFKNWSDSWKKWCLLVLLVWIIYAAAVYLQRRNTEQKPNKNKKLKVFLKEIAQKSPQEKAEKMHIFLIDTISRSHGVNKYQINQEYLLEKIADRSIAQQTAGLLQALEVAKYAPENLEKATELQEVFEKTIIAFHQKTKKI